MTKYKTSDIFRRAKQLADLEGTDFISWNEATNLINESWVTLYQKLIDKGDSAFVKEYEISAGDYKLPSDFWQLKGLFADFNGEMRTIERRAENGSYNDLSYEIKNNVLHIYGSYDHIKLQYFTTPKTLTFKPSDIATGLTKTVSYLCCYDSMYVYLNDTYFAIVDIKDSSRSQEEFCEYEENEKCWLSKDYFIYKTATAWNIVDIASGNKVTITIEDDVDYAPIFTEDGSLYWFKSTDTTKEIYLLEVTGPGNFIKVKDTDVITEGDEFYCDNDLTDFFSLNDGLVEHNGEDVGDFAADKLIYFKGECYFLRSLCFGKITADDEVYIIKNSPGAFIGFNHIDERTGYGYTTKQFGNYYICPFCEDTELDYPNSFFFQILGYMIAVSMRIKQGADATALQSQLSAMESTFFDTLGSDAYQTTRITNCY